MIRRKFHFDSPQMKLRRGKLRNNPTDYEDKLWKFLRRNGLGVKFRRQYSIDNYVVDFYCPEWRLAVELEGKVHLKRKKYDEYRKKYIEAFGIKMINFPNENVNKDIIGVLKEIVNNAPS